MYIECSRQFDLSLFYATIYYRVTFHGDPRIWISNLDEMRIM